MKTRCIKWIVTLCLLLAAFFCCNALAEQEGDWTYYCSRYDGTATITEYTGSDTSITVPSQVGGYKVTGIDYQAFRNCTSLTSVSLPDSITSIGWSAFSGCTSLTSIHIPDGVTSIGKSAFENCTSLTSINIPDNVTSIAAYTFSGCTSLISISIPDGVISIGYWAFYGCTSLTSISIPDSVTSIGYEAFSGCTSLTSISIPNSVTSIGDHAFYKCTSLTSIRIPDSVTSIGNSAFSGCTSLTSISIPNSVTSIDYDAFYNCTSLKHIYLPNSVKEIQDSAFGGCPATIYCYEFSYAESWARDQGREVVLLDGQDTTISMSENVTVAVGAETQIKASIMPRKADQKLNWTVSDSAMASIDAEGKLTAKKAGSFTVTLTVDGVSAQTQVEAVTPVKEIILPEALYVAAKTTEPLRPRLSPSDARAELTYSTDDSAYATVDDQGNLTGGAVGDCTLTVKDTLTGLTITRTVHTCYPVTEITLEPLHPVMKVGDSQTIPAHVKMRDQSCENQLLTYTSSDASIAWVNQDCWVLAKAPGIITITATAQSGVTASVEITVNGEAATTLPGDITADGNVNIMDVIRLLKKVSGWDVTVNEAASDVTGDGKTDIMDVIRLLKYVSGWEVKLAGN